MKNYVYAFVVALSLVTLSFTFPATADPSKPTSLADLLSGSDGSGRGRASD